MLLLKTNNIYIDKRPAECAPTANELTVVIIGQKFENWDIVLQSHVNKLQRISDRGEWLLDIITSGSPEE